MLASTSRLPFLPQASIAFTAFIGLVCGLVLTGQVLPDLTLPDELDRATNTRLAHDLFAHQTGQPPPGSLTLRLLQVDATALTILRRSHADTDARRLARQAHLPLVVDYIVWWEADGRLAAYIGLTGTGELVSYLNAEVPVTTFEPLPETAVARARDFLNSNPCVGVASLGVPEVERVPGQTETEVRWQQPVAESPTLTRVIIVRLRGETVWYFQDRLQPTAPDDWIRPLDLITVLPLLGLPLKIGLLGAALVYLLKTTRRHAILWQVPTTTTAVVGVSCLLTLLLSLPYGLKLVVFNDPIEDSNPLRLLDLQKPYFLLLTIGSYIAWGGVTVFLPVVAVVWVVCAALRHIEYESQRPYTEFFRSVMLLRRVPYATALERSLVGGSVGWVLLGLTGVFLWLATGRNKTIATTGEPLTLFLDAWLPGLLVFGSLVWSTLEYGIVFIAFVWLALANWLRLPPRLAWIVAALCGGLGFSLGNGDPLAIWTAQLIDDPWLWGRNIGLALVAVATFERFGLWATFCALWVYQATSLAIIAAVYPGVGFSPWLPTLLVMLPFTVIALAWRRPESERDVRPMLLDRVAEEQRQARQLAVAARIQASFLPADVPHCEGWDIAAATLPAREVGGDFYDFFQRPGKTLDIFVGDVSGKSVSGALFTVVAITAFRSEAEEEQLGCAAMLSRLNTLLYPDMKRVRMFVAATYVRLDLVGGHLTVANAGLPTPAYRRCGALSGVSNVTFLEIGGLPLGSFRHTAYNELHAVLHNESRDCLVLTSDGVVEAINEKGESYGYEALAAVIDRQADHGAQAICEAILADVKRHMGDAEQSDDMTVLVIQRRPSRAVPKNGPAHTTSRSASSSTGN